MASVTEVSEMSCAWGYAQLGSGVLVRRGAIRSTVFPKNLESAARAPARRVLRRFPLECPMPVDLPNLLLGLLAAAIPLAGLAWQLQRRASLAEREIALLGERLATAQLAQDGLNAQLETSREAYQQLGERHARLAGEVAALRRGSRVDGEERQRASQAEARWASERQGREEEVRRLASERAALAAELREQQESHQQRLTDLQSARDELRAQFAELAGKIFDEREQRFAETSQQRLGQMLDPLKERIQAFEKRVEESYQQEARERFSLSKELERLQQLNLRLGEEATNLTRALKGQKTQGNWGELVLERVLEHAGLEKRPGIRDPGQPEGRRGRTLPAGRADPPARRQAGGGGCQGQSHGLPAIHRR